MKVNRRSVILGKTGVQLALVLNHFLCEAQAAPLRQSVSILVVAPKVSTESNIEEKL